jgi:hypothetical protein
MLNFVKGNYRLVERRRQLLCAKLGGYSIVDSKIINICIKSSWLDKWKREMDMPDTLARVVWNGEDDTKAWKVK